MRPTHATTLRSLTAALVCAAGLWLALPAPLYAAPAKQTVAKEQAPSRFLSVAVDKSQLVEVSAPAATVFIANPEIADVQVVTPTRIMVYGKKAGETTLIVSDVKGGVLTQRSISVRPDLSDLQASLAALSPLHPLRAESMPNGLILTGEAADATIVEEARRLAARYVPKEDGDIVNRIHVTANNQVQIRVRFAEVSRDVDKRFGINWENVGKAGGFAFGLATGTDFVSTGSTSWTRSTVGDATNDSFNVSYNGKRYSVNGMIDALAKDGLVTILAEPTLTAMSGETASFLAGGEFPVPVPQSSDSVTISWKQYGVSLAFTPTITNGSRINLHVRPEVSQLSDAGAVTIGTVQVPALTTRRAETTVELDSGQSFAIAGLLNSQQSQSLEKYPFLGDLPILGDLFRSSRFQNDETELVIIITPYIVKPTTQEHLALPTDGFAAPSDSDFFFNMKQANPDPNARTLSGEPRAVKVEDMRFEEAPSPTAAPLPPVTRAGAAAVSAPVALPAPSPAPLSNAPQTMPAITNHKADPADLGAPAGPGGFMME